MRLLHLKGNLYAQIICLTNLRIDDSIRFLEVLKKAFHGVIVQAFDARYIAGEEHMKHIALQTVSAIENGSLYADKPEMDMMMRVACESQISNAVKAAGLKPRTKDTVIVAIGRKGTLRPSPEIFDYGEECDGILEPSKERQRFLMTHHKLNRSLISSTITPDGSLAALLAEKASLLAAER